MKSKYIKSPFFSPGLRSTINLAFSPASISLSLSHTHTHLHTSCVLHALEILPVPLLTSSVYTDYRPPFLRYTHVCGLKHDNQDLTRSDAHGHSQTVDILSLVLVINTVVMTNIDCRSPVVGN